MNFINKTNYPNDEIKIQLKSKKEIFVFIDEVQLIPKILNEVHRAIEDFKTTDLKQRVAFILSGSSARKLKKKEANLLAGRAFFLKFFPLNCREINFVENLEKILRFGLLPEVFSDNNSNENDFMLITVEFSGTENS